MLMTKDCTLKEGNLLIFPHRKKTPILMKQLDNKMIRIKMMMRIKKQVDGLKKNMKSFWKPCAYMEKIGIKLKST